MPTATKTEGAAAQGARTPAAQRHSITHSVRSNWFAMAVNAVVSFAITPMLVHGLGDVQFGMWVLAGSLLGYYGMIDMGIRTTV